MIFLQIKQSYMQHYSIKLTEKYTITLKNFDEGGLLTSKRPKEPPSKFLLSSSLDVNDSTLQCYLPFVIIALVAGATLNYK